MKSLIIKATIVAFISTFTFYANAGFHLEPNIDYTLSGEWEQGNADDDLSMLLIGVKLGYQAPMGLQVGGDIQIGAGSIDAGNSDFDSAQVDFGAYLGYQSPIGIRASFSYYLGSALAIDGAGDPTYTGNGFRLGVGYSFKRQNLSWLAVNLNYSIRSYDEIDDNFTIGSQSLINDFETESIMLSVSFPFNFGR